MTEDDGILDTDIDTFLGIKGVAIFSIHSNETAYMFNINCQTILYCLTYLSTYLANLCIDKKFSKIVKSEALGIFLFVAKIHVVSAKKERQLYFRAVMSWVKSNDGKVVTTEEFTTKQSPTCTKNYDKKLLPKKAKERGANPNRN